MTGPHVEEVYTKPPLELKEQIRLWVEALKLVADGMHGRGFGWSNRAPRLILSREIAVDFAWMTLLPVTEGLRRENVPDYLGLDGQDDVEKVVKQLCRKNEHTDLVGNRYLKINYDTTKTTLTRSGVKISQDRPLVISKLPGGVLILACRNCGNKHDYPTELHGPRYDIYCLKCGCTNRTGDAWIHPSIGGLHH